MPDTPSTSNRLPVVVVGGGLAGCMTALLLAKHDNTDVVVLESREDFRVKERKEEGEQIKSSLKRSINLALSYRGISALRKAGVFEQSVESALIPMRARVVHLQSGGISVQPYGVGDQAINSISRVDLNRLLLDELDKLKNVKVHFECKVNRITAEGVISYSTPDKKQHSIDSRFVVGADGAYSAVRQSLQRLARVDFSMNYIKHGYKELNIPPTADGQFALPHAEGLHIWPRHEFMLIALPNPDKSFTCTLFAPFEGEDGLDSIQTDEQILAYFNKYFPDSVPLMPTLLQDYHSNPASALLSVRASPWTYKDKIVILGDAAHACVPFYGQGMNAAFEDALVFDELYSQYNGDESIVLPKFNEVRVPTGHAIADLSQENYVEMRSKTASPVFVAKKKIEKVLNYLAPNWWIPQYTMVAFTRTPYHIAHEKGKRQDQILNAALLTAAVGVVGTAVAAATMYLPALQRNQQQQQQRPRFPPARSYYKA